MSLHADDITDLANLTLEELGENRVTDIASDLQSYPALERLMPDSKVEIDGGTSCQFNLIWRGDGNTRTTSLFGVDNVNQRSGSLQGDIPWRYVTTGMEFDVRQKKINQGPRQIVDFIKFLRYQRNISLAEKFAEYFWDGPTDSGDTETPYGLINYWLDYDATTGFNGGNHTNFSSGPAGISCITYPNWKHYTANYSEITDEDLCEKVRKSIRFANFQGVPNVPIKDYSIGDQNWMIYTTADTLFGIESLLRGQNDNLKASIGSYMDMATIGRVPIAWVPYLENNHAASDPVIGINWSLVHVKGLRDEWNEESPFVQAPYQHKVRVSHLDFSFNITCENRRNGLFLIAKSDPLSD